MLFNKDLVLANMEALRQPNGAFIAAPTPDYRAMWIRDHLYMSFAYYYLGDYQKLVESIRIVFNVLHKHRHKLDRVIHPRDENGRLISHALINAKYEPITLNEFTNDWGDHQLDSIGLFLHIVADLNFKNIDVLRDEGDKEILQLLIFYLQNVQYWREPDNGIWEEFPMRHSSSIGAVVAGLSYIERRFHGHIVVPGELIQLGRNELTRILPFESRDPCDKTFHNHDCDAAQLFLIWPFNVLDRPMADIILSRIIDGHKAEDGTFHRLVQPLGIQRYWGDAYRQSDDGISCAWQWDFLVSIIFSQRREYAKALEWFKRGASRITPEGYVTEGFTNGKPNDHTPLGWIHAIALIAFSKLPADIQKRLTRK
ncbi:MAG: hypothetical protein HYS57_02500 [Parcubacteria group bacterium]|nr:hypothetical protein [Parcubacteria group bacterium]